MQQRIDLKPPRQVEIHCGAHQGRPGWGLARIAFNPADPEHVVVVDAALEALLRARILHNSHTSQPEAACVAKGGELERLVVP
jgi:hypothetical protein